MHKVLISAVGAALMATSAVGVAAQSGEDLATRAPIPSAGCGASQVEPGTYDFELLTVDDAQKSWAMHIPHAHDGITPLPLWLDLHGVGGTGYGQVVELKRNADELGFVVAAPTEYFGSAGWTWREADPVLDTSMSNPDIAYVVTLLDHLGASLCIDLARVYVAGHSRGGEGASVLGCVLEDRIAAVAAVAAMLDVGDACVLDRPVPFLAVHGKTDGVAYFDGGYSSGLNDFPVVLALAQTSIPERIASVALRNSCGETPSVGAIDDKMERWTWACPAGAEVELIVHDGGHRRSRQATELIWEFFQQHPMPE